MKKNKTPEVHRNVMKAKKKVYQKWQRPLIDSATATRAPRVFDNIFLLTLNNRPPKKPPKN